MKLFCINLKKSALRREEFHKHWVNGLGYDVEYFEAVDKDSIPESDLNHGQRSLSKLSFSPYGTFRNHRYSFSGLMACTLSHKKLLSSIQNDIGEEGIVVFEDDVIPMEGAEKLKERIDLARKHSPQIEAIICNKFVKPIRLIGLQILNDTVQGKSIIWDESVHTAPIAESESALVKISPPGSFFMWYSKKGVSRMLNLIEGREFLSVDILYGTFAQQGVLAILTPGLGYHPKNESDINKPPFTTI